MPTERAFVAGAGLMGHGIAQVLAAAGRTVDLFEPDLTWRRFLADAVRRGARIACGWTVERVVMARGRAAGVRARQKPDIREIRSECPVDGLNWGWW